MVIINEKVIKRINLLDHGFKFYYCDRKFHITTSTDKYTINDIDTRKYEHITEKIITNYKFISNVPTICPSCKEKFYYDGFCHKCNVMVLQMQIVNVNCVV